MLLDEPNPQTCPECPYRFYARGCPNWIGVEFGFIESNVLTGEERVVTGCFPKLMPKLMRYVVISANRPAAAMESLRNYMIKGFRLLAGKEMRDNFEKLILTDHAMSGKVPVIKRLKNGEPATD